MTMQIERLAKKIRWQDPDVSKSLKGLAKTAEAAGVPKEFSAPTKDIPTQITDLAIQFTNYPEVQESLNGIAKVAKRADEETRAREKAQELARNKTQYNTK